MTESEAFGRLKQMTQADADPTLTDSEVQQELDANKVADNNGLAPGEEGWTPTYHLNRAASRLWELKASKAVPYVAVQGDGLAVASEQVFRHCLDMAKTYRKRVQVTVTVKGNRSSGLTY